MVLALTVLVAAGIFAFLTLSGGQLDLSQLIPTREQPALPTVGALAALPTTMPGPTAERLQPTWTPSPLQPTDTLPPSPTRRPTLEPSITPTLPPPTPTRTPTHTPTETPTETPTGPTPTATNTRSPFPFTKSIDTPTYLRNYANTAGCNWLGIAGEVVDLSGNPVSAGSYQVHVWESGIDARVAVGTAPAYGPSGWEQFVFDSPIIRTYNVQLESSAGTPVSQVYQVQTRASCNENLLFIIFVQNH